MKRQPATDIKQIATKRICCGCVDERFLKMLIEAEGSEAICSYCDDEAKTFTIEQLADRIEKAFEDHYERTPNTPDDLEAAMHNDSESNYCWERHGEEVKWAIVGAADIEEEVAIDLVAVLEERHADFESAKMGEECEFDNDSYYAEKDPGCHEFSYKWTEFENRLKTEARFFSRSAQATLDEIFADLPKLKTAKGAPVVVHASPEAEIKYLHRARVFAAENELLEEALKFPWRHLGPPPMRAASAGRMNARGISVFYGAIDSATTLAEVRPPVGSQVAVAKFTIERPLKLLDVAALKSVITPGSIFDPTYVRQLQRANFLKILSDRISSPVMPHEEAIEYLPTQAVADYLAIEAKLDGIIFPSVQVGQESSNVVLFHHASRVAEIELPKGTELSANLEDHDSDGITPAYRVWEIVPAETKTNTSPESDPLDFLSLPEVYEPFDARPVSLKIELASIQVHHIKSVSFSADEYPVDRHRSVMPENNKDL